MKTLNLNLRRVRSSVRTDVSTGSRKAQSNACAYSNGAAKPGQPPAPIPGEELLSGRPVRL